MSTYEVLSLLFFGGSFLIALLAYIDSRNSKLFSLSQFSFILFPSLSKGIFSF